MTKNSIFIVLIFLFASLAFAESISLVIEYLPEDFVIEKGRWTNIHLKNGTISGLPGEPQCPSEPLNVLLPPSSKITNAYIESPIWVDFENGIPFPAQPPFIFSAGSPGIIEPDIATYSQDKWFPQNPILSFSSGNLSGYSVAGIIIAPIRWNPAMNKSQRLAGGNLMLEFTSQNGGISTTKRTQMGHEIWQTTIKNIVLNPEMLERYSVAIDPNAYDWAVYAPSSLIPSLEQLKRLRRGWGLRDTIISLTTVNSIYTGADSAEKLRNAIIDAYLDLGITYALIIGDEGVAPTRTVWAMDCEAGFYPDENEIRGDIYFSDLDGNWNLDGDAIYGEVADSIDMYPDVFVGRFSLRFTAQLNGFLNKLVRYESIPSANFAKSGLMLSQVLWDDPYTDAGIFKDEISSTIFPADFSIGRVYGSAGGNAIKARDSLNAGPNLVNHAGHASTMLMCINHGSCIASSDMDLLTNSFRPSIFFSIGCWPAAFDKDCIAEHYLNNVNGGGSAFIGNSRYGWGSPGNPGWGYSEVIDRAFWRAIFSGSPDLGSALSIAKARFIPYARWENVWRWVIYQTNILGDPATKAITGWHPISLDVASSGGSACADVLDSFGNPVRGAVVSAFNNSRLIDRGITNSSGKAFLNISGASAPIYITARFGSEGFSAETLSTALSSGFFRFRYDSSFGYLDGKANPGDTVVVRFSMGGFSSAITGIAWNPISNFGAPLWRTDPPTSIPAGDSASFSSAFFIPFGLSPDTTLIVNPRITGSIGTIGFPVSLRIDAGKLNVIGIILSATDSSLDSGETGIANIEINNYGSGISELFPLYLSCPGGELNISGSPSIVPPIAPGDTSIVGYFTLNWSSPSSIKPVVPLVAYAMGLFTDTLYLATRPLGFYHDAEFTNIPFYIGRPGSLWHRTTRRSHSGGRSWWCGSVPVSRYLPDMNDWIVSDRFIMGDGTILSFWAFMAFPTYGSDGLHVYIATRRDTTEIDFLGSGGALLSFIVGWAEYRYELKEQLFPGDTFSIIFRFTSDSEDQDEGVFLDDISLSSTRSGFAADISEKPKIPENISIDIRPNPFNSALQISVLGDLEKDAKICIFDISGRLIKKFYPNKNGIILWDGVSENGMNCASGIYFIRLISGKRVVTKKGMLIR